MSPEQAAGNPVDHRTDIYSLGIMLYEMASGQLPFNADNFMAILSQHMYQAPTPIREIASECSPGLEAVILKCLSKKPEARYQTMDELKADLEKVKAGEIPSAVSEMMTRSEGFDVPPEYFKPRGTSASHVPAAQRRPWGLYAAAVLALLAGVGATIFAYFALKQPVSVDKPTTGTALAQTAPPPPPSDVAPAPVPPPSAEAQVKPAETQEPATITAQEPKKISVGIAAMPDSAMAYRDGKALKLPSTIEVEEGKSVTVEVRADGYETAVVSLDGKEAIKMVKLNKLAVGSGTAKPSTPPGGKAGSSEIVDPYGSKYQQKKVSPKK
jgi:serine/threonine-protein kinase